MHIIKYRVLQQINKAASFRDFHKDCIPNAVNLSDTVPVPFEQPADSFFDFNFVGPAEAVEFAYVYEFAHCAVGLGGIKCHFSGKTYGFYNKSGKLPYCQFLACADIDVTIADFTQRRDGSTSAGAVVAVHCTICSVSVMDRGIFLYADYILEIHIQEDVYAGI